MVQQKALDLLVGKGGGHGITGMSERARLLGGTFEAAPKFGGGFRVEAFLPLPKGEGTSA